MFVDFAATAGEVVRGVAVDAVEPATVVGAADPATVVEVASATVVDGAGGMLRVAVGSVVATYTGSGLGPREANPSAPAGSPERYVDFPGGTLPPGVTLTEAQAINALKAINENLKAQGLTVEASPLICVDAI